MKYFHKFNNMSLAIASRFSDVDCVIVDHSASASTWLPCPLWPKTLVEELHLCFSSTKPQLAAQLVTICLTLFLGWRLKLFLGLFTASLLFHTFPSFNCRREFYFVLFLAPGYGPFPPRLRIWCLSGVLDQRLLWKVPPPALPSYTAMLPFLAMPPCSPSWLNFWMSWTKGVTSFMFSYLIQSSSKQHQFKMHSNEYSCSFSSVCCHKLWNHCKVNVLTVQSCFYRCNCLSGAPVLAVWPRYWLCMLRSWNGFQNRQRPSKTSGARFLSLCYWVVFWSNCTWWLSMLLWLCWLWCCLSRLLHFCFCMQYLEHNPCLENWHWFSCAGFLLQGVL